MVEKKLISHYEKVGRITMPIAKSARIKAGNILVNNNYLKHIDGTHLKELSALGMTAQDFIIHITSSFNRIYRDMDTEVLFLVIYHSNITHSAVIKINFIDKKSFWEIKTAAPFRTAFFKNKLLVWQRERTP